MGSASYLSRCARIFPITAGSSMLAITRTLAIFMYNEERTVPLDFFDAETFDASHYKEKPVLRRAPSWLSFNERWSEEGQQVSRLIALYLLNLSCNLRHR